MDTDRIAAALARASTLFSRRPEAAQRDDSPGVVRWQGGTRMVARHASGREVETDMPPELGGEGAGVAPGWLLRAGVASCTATSIAMTAAREGIALDTLEVEVASRSDARGLLGVPEPDGAAVTPGPLEVRMRVRIAARGVPQERLRSLVQAANGRSPMTAALRNAYAVPLAIEFLDGA